MEILLIYSPAPRQVREWLVNVPAGSKAVQVLENSGIFEVFPDLQHHNLQLGVWGQQVKAEHILRPDDRLEVYRHLMVDPKIARRERFKRQGSKGTGLFAGVRSGGKAGY